MTHSIRYWQQPKKSNKEIKKRKTRKQFKTRSRSWLKNVLMLQHTVFGCNSNRNKPFSDTHTRIKLETNCCLCLNADWLAWIGRSESLQAHSDLATVVFWPLTTECVRVGQQGMRAGGWGLDKQKVFRRINVLNLIRRKFWRWDCFFFRIRVLNFLIDS